VLFVFPPALPVTGNNMNYCIVAFAIWLIISTVQWFVDGRKNYTGPSIDMKAMQQGEVMGMAVDSHENGPAMEGSEKALKDGTSV
jgi:choline transport protein